MRLQEFSLCSLELTPEKGPADHTTWGKYPGRAVLLGWAGSLAYIRGPGYWGKLQDPVNRLICNLDLTGPPHI